MRDSEEGTERDTQLGEHTLDSTTSLNLRQRSINGVLFFSFSEYKMAAQRWQDNAADDSFDVVFTFKEKVFDMDIKGWFLLSYFFFFSFCIVIYNMYDV